jgi:RNA polymerase sigma-70 factor (ECF subfamily)
MIPLHLLGFPGLAIPQANVSDATAVVQDREREWLRRVARGDKAAFEDLYRAYHRRVFGYLFRTVWSAEAAEELASDVMLEVWKVAATFRGDSQVSTWILGIARFKALSALRRPRRDAVDVDQARNVDDPHDLQDEVLAKESLKTRIKHALRGLSPEHREVIELTFFQELAYPEIARILECPVNTVKTRMFYARKQLRGLLETEAVS